MNIKSLLLGCAAALCITTFASASTVDIPWTGPPTHAAGIEPIKIDKVAIKEIITNDEGNGGDKRPYNPPVVLTEGWGGIIVKDPGGTGGEKLALGDDIGMLTSKPDGDGMKKPMPPMDKLASNETSVITSEGDGGFKKPNLLAPNFGGTRLV